MTPTIVLAEFCSLGISVSVIHPFHSTYDSKDEGNKGGDDVPPHMISIEGKGKKGRRKKVEELRSCEYFDK
jgi:hypothetical protein